MTKGVFSVFSVPSYGNIQNQEKKSETTTKTVTSDKKQLISKIKSAAPVIVPLAAIPITALITYKISAKNVNALKSQISSLTDDISKLQKIAAEAKTTAEKGIDNVIKTGKKDNAQIWGALLAAGGLLGIYKVSDMTDDQKKEAAEKISNRIDNIQNTGKYALNMAEQSSALSSNNLGRKYTVNYNGIQLLTNSDSINKNEQKYAQAINQIQNAAPDRLYKTPNIKPIKSKRPTLWSISSEFAPIKEGGLGSVPVEIQNNVSKLGINIPTFIPMYQQKGTATFRTERGQYFYTYKGVEMKVDKAASLQLDTYQNGRPKTETVEFYVYNSKDEKGNNKQLVLVKNDNYFNGTIYQTSEKTEEPEKFAFFSKAVYELAK